MNINETSDFGSLSLEGPYEQPKNHLGPRSLSSDLFERLTSSSNSSDWTRLSARSAKILGASPQEKLDAVVKKFQEDKADALERVKSDGLELCILDKQFQKDRDVVLAAVSRNGWALEFADKSFRKDKEIVLAAASQNGWVLEIADETLRKDKEVVLAAVAQDSLALQFADETLRKDKEVVLIAVTQDGLALRFADETLREDKEVVLAAVTQDGLTLQFADETLRKDKEVVLTAIRKNILALEFADKTVREDREIALVAVSQNGVLLQLFSNFQDDKEIVSAALKQDFILALYASEALRFNRDFIDPFLDAEQRDLDLEEAAYNIPILYYDRDEALKAVSKDGLALRSVSKDLRNDRDLILAAMKQNIDAYRYSPQRIAYHLLDDKEAVIAIVAVSTEQAVLLGSVSRRLRDDADVVRAAIAQDPDAALSLPSALEQYKQSSGQASLLFTSKQRFMNGEVNIDKAEEFISTLNREKSVGVLFRSDPCTILIGGTCSAMSLTFANYLLSRGEVQDFQQLESVLSDLVKDDLIKSYITHSHKDMRTLQAALNTIQLENRQARNNDFSKIKVESLATIYNFSIPNSSESITIQENSLENNLEKEINHLPNGNYLLRAINHSNNEKLERFGHSMIFIKCEDFYAFYDPNVGITVAGPNNLIDFIKKAPAASLRMYQFDNARFYRLEKQFPEKINS